MRKVTMTLAAFTLTVALTVPAFAANQIRISQVYSGGGSSTAGTTYSKDYVELFNNGPTAVDISGWVIEYGSATGNWGSSAGNYFTLPTGTVIQSCSYILVACGSVGTAGAAVPSPDFTTTNMSMAAANGKVGLFNALNANLPCGSELAGTLVDKVAWGTGNCPEGTAIAALSTTTGGVRNGNGIADTDNNVADFTVVTNPVPRNSSSPANSACQPVPTESTTWGGVKALYR